MRRKNTVVSPGDAHIVGRNIQRLQDILRINCAPSWLYLQERNFLFRVATTEMPICRFSSSARPLFVLVRFTGNIFLTICLLGRLRSIKLSSYLLKYTNFAGYNIVIAVLMENAFGVLGRVDW